MMMNCEEMMKDNEMQMEKCKTAMKGKLDPNKVMSMKKGEMKKGSKMDMGGQYDAAD